MKFSRLIVMLALTGCASTSFTKTGFDVSPVKPSQPCEAVVLQRLPQDRKMLELGFCTTSVPGGGIITDNTSKAIRELQECACSNGGNAVLLVGDNEDGFQSAFGYSQQRIKARGIVLYVFPTR